MSRQKRPQKREPRFHVGQRVRVVKLLDVTTSPSVIGFEGIVVEIDSLPNGDFNYTVEDRYMHEEELEEADPPPEAA